MCILAKGFLIGKRYAVCGILNVHIAYSNAAIA